MHTNIIQRAYETGMIFELSCTPKNGFDLKVLVNDNWVTYLGMRSFSQVRYWLTETAKANFGKEL